MAFIEASSVTASPLSGLACIGQSLLTLSEADTSDGQSPERAVADLQGSRSALSSSTGLWRGLDREERLTTVGLEGSEESGC